MRYAFFIITLMLPVSAWAQLKPDIDPGKDGHPMAARVIALLKNPQSAFGPDIDDKTLIKKGDALGKWEYMNKNIPNMRLIRDEYLEKVYLSGQYFGAFRYMPDTRLKPAQMQIEMTFWSESDYRKFSRHLDETFGRPSNSCSNGLTIWRNLDNGFALKQTRYRPPGFENKENIYLEGNAKKNRYFVSIGFLLIEGHFNEYCDLDSLDPRRLIDNGKLQHVINEIATGKIIGAKSQITQNYFKPYTQWIEKQKPQPKMVNMLKLPEERLRPQTDTQCLEEFSLLNDLPLLPNSTITISYTKDTCPQETYTANLYIAQMQPRSIDLGFEHEYAIDDPFWSVKMHNALDKAFGKPHWRQSPKMIYTLWPEKSGVLPIFETLSGNSYEAFRFHYGIRLQRINEFLSNTQPVIVLR